jgi:hypothetical protein
MPTGDTVIYVAPRNGPGDRFVYFVWQQTLPRSLYMPLQFIAPHASPRTPGSHANGCLCSPRSAASDAFCRSSPLLAPLFPMQFKQVFRMCAGFFLADQMVHPAAECLNREPVLAAINRAIHPALTPRLDGQRPIRAVCVFPGPRRHRRSFHVGENPIWNDTALSESRARFGRLRPAD